MNKAERIREYISENPDVTPNEIATHVGCSTGYANALNKGYLKRRSEGTSKFRVVMALDLTCPITDAGEVMQEVEKTLNDLRYNLHGEWADAIIRPRRGSGRPDLHLYGTRKGKVT